MRLGNATARLVPEVTNWVLKAQGSRNLQETPGHEYSQALMHVRGFK
jgi:hypothetical protein